MFRPTWRPSSGLQKAGSIETNVGPVWLDVEISSSAQCCGGYRHVRKMYKYTKLCAKTKKGEIKLKIKNKK
jgi:hypothetical protein